MAVQEIGRQHAQLKLTVERPRYDKFCSAGFPSGMNGTAAPHSSQATKAPCNRLFRQPFQRTLSAPMRCNHTIGPPMAFMMLPQQTLPHMFAPSHLEDSIAHNTDATVAIRSSVNLSALVILMSPSAQSKLPSTFVDPACTAMPLSHMQLPGILHVLKLRELLADVRSYKSNMCTPFCLLVMSL